MKTVELFAGTKSFSKVMAKYGHKTFTVDNNTKFKCNLTEDLSQMKLSTKLISKILEANIVWMSPPCTTFSLASGNTHWDINRNPKTPQAVIGLQMLDLCKEIAEAKDKQDKIFFIENPNGRAVWFLPNKWLKRVWYCQYGDIRAKPTNIWTNLDIDFKTCHRYNKNQILCLEPKHCHHEPARRWSKTGTQGLKGNMERSIIPEALFEHILEVINERERI